jgi:hypothetical protein
MELRGVREHNARGGSPASRYGTAVINISMRTGTVHDVIPNTTAAVLYFTVPVLYLCSRACVHVQ